jgi:predicted ATPase/DNA-binding CsgD family transcriptional regulator
MHSPTRSNQNDAGSFVTHEWRSARLPEPLTSLIGRDDRIAELRAFLLLPSTRLLTLIGPGGVGKTRLALAVASTFDNAGTPVVFVPLASIRDPSLVESSIGAAFGLGSSGEQSLAERLSFVLHDSPVLLLLDNFEHVVEAAPVVPRLVTLCPRLQVLATSRRPLNVSGEMVVAVSPLPTPRPGDTGVSIDQSPAVRLFVDRAAGSRPADAVDPIVDLTAIADICTRLDGLPLAIELAASRTRVLPPAELLARLERRLSLLSGGPADAPARLKSMREAIGWSYDLLTNDEQRFLRTLSVFSGGFTLEAAEAVAPIDIQDSVLELLTCLLDHSLVRRMETEAETARFTMLETIREFALEALSSHGDKAVVQDRHLAWMVDFVGSPTPDRFYEMRKPADPVLYDELNNLRLAFSWAIDRHDAPRAAQIAWGMLRIWWHYGLTSEALESIQRLIDHPEGLDPVVYATTMEWAASFAHHHGDDERAQFAAARALDMFRQLGNTLGTNLSLGTLAHSTAWSNPGAAIDLFSQAIELGHAMDDKRVLAWNLNWRSHAFIALGDVQRALSDLHAALDLFEQFQIDDEVRFDQSLAMYMTAWAWGLCGRTDLATQGAVKGLEFANRFNIGFGIFAANRVLGELARVQGNLQQAFAHLRACLLTAHREALESWKTFVIIQIAMLAQAAGDWRRAARLFGYSDGYWTRHTYADSTRSVATWGYTVDPARRAIGQEAFANEFEAGCKLTEAQALAEASGFTVPESGRSARDSILTRRERDVLTHLAEGKTNKEIADALFIGKSTVDTHVAHILDKLGVESRRAAVRAARTRRLLPE